MEAVRTFEISVYFNENTLRYNTEGIEHFLLRYVRKAVI
jgi:hypothetical protein